MMNNKVYVKLNNINNKTPNIIMEGCNPKNQSVGVNQKFFTKNNEPWFPVMGEIHYLRYPKKYWREAIQKIKAGGIDIIATYVFWIYHEEEEGVFDWTGNKNLSYFLQLCEELDVYVLLRIGPWAHGEVRNGAYPDWLLEKDYELGVNNLEYFSVSRKWYEQVYSQSSRYLYKNGGPIIGIQIDNEYGHCHGLHGDEGIEHMRTLKEIALSVGFDVPLYTATGWGGGIVVENEMIPVMAAYAEGAWEEGIHELPPNINYIYSSVKDDLAVGSDLVDGSFDYSKKSYTPENYPFATCELGGGMQVNSQRRPIVTADDTEVIAHTKLGSGANMLGYYMYHGGTNGIGKFSTLQESRETGYLNDLPILNYDYQAPIGEYGQIRQPFKQLKLLHMFVKDYGAFLTTTDTVIIDEDKLFPENVEDLRCSIRYKENSGYVFLNNYQRSVSLPTRKNVNIEIELMNEIIRFKEFDLNQNDRLIMPFNLDLSGIMLKCVNAQPLCKLNVDNEPTYVFFSYNNANFTFESHLTLDISSTSGSIENKDNNYNLCDVEPSKDTIINITDSNRNEVRIILLDRYSAENCQKLVINEKEFILISEYTYLEDSNELVGLSTKNNDITILPNSDYIEIPTPLTDNLVKPITITDHKVTEEYHSWSLNIPYDELEKYKDVFMLIDYKGDVGELYLNNTLVADDFYKGLKWEVGLKRFKKQLLNGKFELRIKPLKEDAFVALDIEKVFANGEMVQLNGVDLIPELRYSL